MTPAPGTTTPRTVRGWTKKQRSVAAMSARNAGLDEDARYLLLRQLDNAKYDERGNWTGVPSSRSARLTNTDYEQYMAMVEHRAGGRLDGWSPGYWAAKAADGLHRMRGLANRIAQQLEAHGHLDPDGAGLRGWIFNRVTDKQHDRLEDLDYHQLRTLIDGLRAYAGRHGIRTAA